VTAALFYEEFTEFLHCMAKEGSRTSYKNQSIGNMESVQEVILCESCVKHLETKMDNL